MDQLAISLVQAAHDWTEERYGSAAALMAVILSIAAVLAVAGGIAWYLLMR